MSAQRIKCIIVEDEEVDRLFLTAMVACTPVLELSGVYTHALEAINAIKQQNPDLLFLDIEMPGPSGIDLLKTVRSYTSMVVFTTSHQEYAVEGFDLHALDYMLKPITEERFSQCVSRIADYWDMKTKSTAYNILLDKEMLTIKQGHDKLKIPLAEIIYLEALNDYTKLHMSSKSYIVLGSLSNILTRMPEGAFDRIHRSYAVARNKVTGLRKNEVVIGSLALPVGKTYKQTLRFI